MITLREEKEKWLGGKLFERTLEAIIQAQPRHEDANPQEFGRDVRVVRLPGNMAETRRAAISESALRRSERHGQQGEPRGRVMLTSLYQPPTLDEALARDDRKWWYDAWEAEVPSLVQNGSWVLT